MILFYSLRTETFEPFLPRVSMGQRSDNILIRKSRAARFNNFGVTR